jgi:pimeloyl-ACP methyl ester carboxylesterase
VVIPGLDGGAGMPTGLSRRLSELEIAGLSRGARVWWIGRKSGLAAGTSIADLAAAYASVIATTFSAPVDVLGASTGGSVALQLTIDHPQLVRRLVLVSAAHRLGDDGRAKQADAGRLLEKGRRRQAAAVLLSNVGVSMLSRTVLGAIGWLSPRLVTGPRTDDVRRLMEAEDGFDVTERLGSVMTPTLIVAGARDRFYSRAIYVECARGLADASLRLGYSGHLSLHGRRRLTREILAFFR